MNDWRGVTAALIGTWLGHQFDRERLAAYVAELQARGVSAEEALLAIRGYDDKFPPSASTIAGMVDVDRQGPAPSWRQAAKAIGRHILLLPYHAPQAGWQTFVEALSTHEHEAVARFAVGLGPAGCREMRDPDASQDRDGAFELGRLEREYRDAAEQWRADPRRGLALEEATRRTLGGSFADGVEALRPVGELTA